MSRKPDQYSAKHQKVEVGNHRMATDQAIIQVGGLKIDQSRIDAWNEGTAKLDEQYQRARTRRHKFVPMGPSYPACEKCAAGKLDRHEGTLIHIN